MAKTKGSTVTFEAAKEELDAIPSEELRKTEKFITGDHWQGSDGWIGWIPESNSKEAADQFLLVTRLFNAKNVCGGMIDRIRGAVLGKEPDWEIVEKRQGAQKPKSPTRGEKSQTFQDLDAALVKWWNDKKIHSKFKEYVSNKAAYGKAALRIYIPAGYVASDGTKTTVSATNLEDALNKIFVEVPAYDSIIDPMDENFGQRYTIMQLVKPNKDDPERIEIVYLDENGKTIVRQVTDKNGDQGITGPALDLRGQLLTYVQGDFCDALISETVKQQQRAVNHAKTGENFALANINFPETTFINASLETEKVKNAAGKEVEVVKPMAQGFGRWRNLIGLLQRKFDGSEEYVTPQVVYRDGADPERFAKVAENNTRDMHQEAGMLYIYMADSEYASGDSKIESMTDYLILLVDYKTMVDTSGEWLLSTVLNFAFNLLKDETKIDSFDVIFSTKLTIGRLLNDDKRVMMEEVNVGLRSRRNYIVTAEVSDDPDSEIQVIKADEPPIDPATGLPRGAKPPVANPANNPPKTAGAGS